MSAENPSQIGEHPLQRGVLYAALALVVVAPLIFGSYPLWISGITIGACCFLGALWVILALIFQTNSFPVPRAVKVPALLLLAWLSALVLRDALGGAGLERSAALSVRNLPYAFAFLAAGMLGAGFGTAQRLKWIYGALTVTCAILAALGLLQWMGFDVKTWKAPIEARASGIMVNANRLAVMEALCASSALALLLSSFKDPEVGRGDELKRRAQQAAMIAILAGIGLSMIMTLSRMTVVAFGVGLGTVAMIWTWRQWRQERSEERWSGSLAERVQRMAFLALPLIVMLGWMAVVVGFGSHGLQARIAELGSTETSDRIRALKESVQLFDSTDAKAFGRGLGQFETTFTPIQPAALGGRWDRLHSDWLQLAIEAGIPALLLALAVTILWVWAWQRKTLVRLEKTRQEEFETWGEDSAGQEYLMRLIPLAGIVTVLICTALDFPLREPGVALAFFFLAGSLVRSEDKPEPRTLVSGPTPLPRAAKTSFALAMVLLAAFGWSAFIAGRNGIAYAASPLRGQHHVPPDVGTDIAPWERAVAIDPADPLLHYYAALAALSLPSGVKEEDVAVSRHEVYARGLEHARIAQTLSPRDYTLAWTAAMLSERLGDADGSLALRERAVALSPGHVQLRLDVGSFWLRRAKLLQKGSSPRAARVAEALKHFQIVMRADPSHESSIVEWMDNANCDFDEVMQIWQDDAPASAIGRARYLWSKRQWALAAEALELVKPETLTAGKKEAIWYYALTGAFEFRRRHDEKGIDAWEIALRMGLARVEDPAMRWMTNEARELNVETVEKAVASEKFVEKLKDVPSVVNVLGSKLHENGKDADACKLLEKTAGSTDYLCALYADAALAMNDWSTAEEQAMRAARYSSTGSDWKAWYVEFEKRLTHLKPK